MRFYRVIAVKADLVLAPQAMLIEQGIEEAVGLPCGQISICASTWKAPAFSPTCRNPRSIILVQGESEVIRRVYAAFIDVNPKHTAYNRMLCENYNVPGWIPLIIIHL